ncbi:MAG: serine/threonine protein kinase [Tetrasphaera sp.]|nr:serine/threonine protein kinase [Tetrasphaera sp.]
MAGDPPRIAGLEMGPLLGSGGYADVYLCLQRATGRDVAVKVLRGNDPTTTERFLAEAELMSSLGQHPHIVTILGWGRTYAGAPYLLMDYYPPPNLAVRSRREPLSVGDVLRLGIQLAGAVETIHRCGVIHRDIKPANVLLDAAGRPALTDFGVAGTALTVSDSPEDDLGVSVPWSAPEVVAGTSDGDPRADVYALCATLWQLLTGRSPFEIPGGDNSTDSLAARVRHENPTPMDRNDVPLALEDALRTGLAKERSDRQPSALALAEALREVQRSLGHPVASPLLLDPTRLRRVDGPTPEGPTLLGGEQSSSGRADAPASEDLDPARAAGRARGDSGLLASGRRRRKAVLAGSGVVAALALAMYVSAAGGGEGAPSSASPSTGVTSGAPATGTPASASAGRTDADPPQLDVSARSVVGGVEFSWPATLTIVTDVFRYREAQSRGSLVTASVQVAESGPLILDAPSGRTVCAQVAVERSDGTVGPYSDAVCGQGG